MDAERVKLIAFYLPQYHPIPENDAWWGKGFTEWTNVARATPLFPGHYQPHLPADLGYYDLRLPEARQAQADLARQYGVSGFCYYHYWFNGRQILERPFDEVLASGKPDFPFCLCWANENWTKAWDGLEQDVLLEQQYSPEDDRRHLRWLARAFRDSRYIRIQGRPLFMVYRISRLPDPQSTAAIWREEARKLGLGELYLCTVESLRDDRLDPRTIGFDAAVEFAPDWLNLGDPVEQLPDHNVIYSYARLSDKALQKPGADYERFACVATGWDNTSRRRRDAIIFADSTPRLYQTWLEMTIAKAVAGNAREPVVFINAWNEWGEAARLEPCQKWGRAYLEATGRAVQAAPARQTSTTRTATVGAPRTAPKVSICIPTYQGERFVGEAIQSVLDQTFTDFELLVVDDASADGTAQAVATFRDARLSYVQNPKRLGMVANWNRCVALARGDYICVFHQDDLMLPENLSQKVSMLDKHPTAGMAYSSVYQVGPAQEFISDYWYFRPEPGEQSLQRGPEFFKRLLSGVNIVCCPSVLARRACYERLGGFDARLPFTADWEMWLRIALFYDVVYLISPLVKYRRHDNNETLSFTGDQDLEQYFRAKSIALNKYPERVPDPAGLRSKVGREYSEQAVERARQHYRQGDFAAAQRSLALAVEAHGLLAGARPAGPDTGWFLEVVDQILGQPQEPAARPVAPVVDEPPAELSRQPTRYQPIFRQVIDNLSGRDIADNIRFRKILQALAFKVANRRGFHWLYRFKGVGKRLLGA